ncbi:FixH family protein [Virgibacillus salidurans]|uniref:FixH family protein n=1 Tax=Virgibacillus salidurans TaxID=2831673 RepID=UPI001F3D6EB4|nr:FixH family protein [Virgibacillus sp. NKC19-16]
MIHKLEKFWLLTLIVAFTFLSACGDDGSTEESGEGNSEDELHALEVEFEVPETADVDETIEMKANVTYGKDDVADADEVVFEYWETGNEDNSTMLEAENNGDGSYTAETAFEEDGVYEMYAHVTARTQHTMPKKSVTVGEGANADQEAENEDTEDGQAQEEGFAMDFSEIDEANVQDQTELMVQLNMDGENFEGANVRYEIWNYDVSDQHEWIDAEESASGEYTAIHDFPETGTYNIQIHVENDDGLHEHEEHEVVVNE